MKAELSEFRERLEKRHERGWKLKKKGQKLIACFYGLVPKELIHAAGMIPIQLVEDRDSRYEEQAALPPYFCGLSKNLAGQIFSRVFEYVDGLMVATVCDTNRRIFDVWEHRKLFPHSLLVRLPVKFSERAVKFYGQECRRLARELVNSMRIGSSSGNSMMSCPNPGSPEKMRYMSLGRLWLLPWKTITPCCASFSHL
jgi:benzoyl-CoA reductase/2-hydroxyglutaryl-CoA dehydratase subunit BcrC/BadD/HgdB